MMLNFPFCLVSFWEAKHLFCKKCVILKNVKINLGKKYINRRNNTILLAENVI